MTPSDGKQHVWDKSQDMIFLFKDSSASKKDSDTHRQAKE